MTPSRPRILLLRAGTAPDPEVLARLRAAYDVEEVDDPAAALAAADADAGALVMLPAAQLAALREALPRVSALADSVAAGMGLVDEKGEIHWMNRALASRDAESMRRYADACVEAIREFDTARATDPEHAPEVRRTVYQIAGTWYEQATAAVIPSAEGERVTQAIGLLWDGTAARHLQDSVEAVDAAGEELLRIDPESIAGMNMADRLRTLERRVVRVVNEVLGFERFEVRLLDRTSGKLELVIAIGLPPLRIGESLYAASTGNGISGIVASTGRSYLCADVSADPNYHDGLAGAASSLTVPLMLQERVVGVLNIESTQPGRFDDEDRLLTELFGRYLALALNILDLLVRERSTTNEQLSTTVLRELRQPMDEIAARTSALRSRMEEDPEAARLIGAIDEAVAAIRARVATCTAGPRSILGVEEALAEGSTDDALSGKRVLVADDEATIRQTIRAVLLQRGAEVVICADGATALSAIRAAASADQYFDLIVSDVRMPDHNGYEIFRASKECAPDTPVILMTGFGYDPHHSIVRSSQEGLHCFLFKPFQIAQLLEEVQKAIAGAPKA